MKQRRITAALLCAILLLSQCNFKIQAASAVTQRQVEDQLAALTAQYEGVAYTDNFNGATQCKGFADMIYDALFHVGTIGIYPAGVYYYMESVSGSTKEVGRVEPGYAALDASAVQPLLEQACPGDYIQMRRRDRSYGHSMIVLEANTTGLKVLHCNWRNDLTCSVNEFSWEDLSLISDGISLYHYKNYQITGSFTDVTPDAWYYSYVTSICQAGVMAGVSETSFGPAEPMTRAMVVTVLYRLSQDTSTYPTTFTDVPAGTWYTNAVGWAQTYGLAAGYENGTFRPNDKITREQFAAFLYRFAVFEGRAQAGGGSDLAVFNDVSQVSGWAYPALQWAVAQKIISGTPNGYLHPLANATRAEAATILAQYISLFRAAE